MWCVGYIVDCLCCLVCDLYCIVDVLTLCTNEVPNGKIKFLECYYGNVPWRRAALSEYFLVFCPHWQDRKLHSIVILIMSVFLCYTKQLTLQHPLFLLRSYCGFIYPAYYTTSNVREPILRAHNINILKLWKVNETWQVFCCTRNRIRAKWY